MWEQAQKSDNVIFALVDLLYKNSDKSLGPDLRRLPTFHVVSG